MDKMLLLLLLTQIVSFSCFAGDNSTVNRIKTECPPILVDDRVRTNYPFGVEGQIPDLIISGSSTFKEKISRKLIYNIEVEEIFYGWTDTTVLDFTYPWKIKDGKMILALVRAKYPKNARAAWQLKYSLNATPENIAGAKALGNARLSYYTFSSKYIFLGRELSFTDDERLVDLGLNVYLRNIKIKDVIVGNEQMKGETILGEISGFRHLSNGELRLLDEDMIYFIEKTAKQGRLRLPRSLVITAVPGALQEQVKQILHTRKNFPIAGGTREILFPGSTEEAIHIMGSESKGAVMLMRRTLNHRGDESRKQVVDAIKKEMLSFEPKTESTSIRLHNLISFLGSTKEGKQELAKLLDLMLLHITGADQVPTTTMPERSRYHYPEAELLDTNHSLLWILQNMDQQVLTTKFAKKLFQVANTIQNRWQAEINLAINSVALQDIIDLKDYLGKNSHIQPLRVPNHQGEGHSGKIQDAYFSIDGKTIFTYGDKGYVCSWDPETKKVLTRNDLPEGHKKAMGIRSDGRYALYPTDPIKVIDAKTGEALSELALPKWTFLYRIHWINDHEALLTTGNYICRFDYLTGKIRKTVKINSSELRNGGGELTEDGKQLFIKKRFLRSSTVTFWHMNHDTGKESAKKQTEPIIHGGYNANGLVPGGKYFYFADPDVYIVSRKTGELVAFKDFVNAELLNIAFSPDGSRYAVVTGARLFLDSYLRIWDSEAKSIIRIHDTISGKMLFACPSPVRFPKALKFSPDGKRLLAAGEDVFEIWPLDSTGVPE